jgi:hypothetical protein
MTVIPEHPRTVVLDRLLNRGKNLFGVIVAISAHDDPIACQYARCRSQDSLHVFHVQ